MSNYLTAADILEAKDLEHLDEPVPEWPKNGTPGLLRLQQLSAGELMDMTEEMNKEGNKARGMFIILARCARDPETGKPIFTEEQVEQLKHKNMKVLNRLQRKAMKLNDLKEIDELKNA